ncbi:hypothetical protein QMY03_05445 [Arthrobacter sp. KFRI-F3372]|uniref:hypothetical protein n=1 Tax=Pseudarthrobacter oxydans TaxID=1671 RepID=UPI00279BD0B4|nr:hypothetical protein QMY03_05445 [Arthrobacter sp. KFRI-F3372]
MKFVFLKILTSDEEDRLRIREVLAAEAAANAAGASFVISVLLLVAALFAAKYARGAWKAAKAEVSNSHEELQMARKFAEEAEAAQVAVWLAQDRDTITAFLRNGNGGPVYDVLWRVMSKPVNSPHSEPTVDVWQDRRSALAPVESNGGHAETVSLKVMELTDWINGGKYFGVDKSDNFRVDRDHRWHLWDGKSEYGGLAVDLTFRDSVGIYWRRTWDGKLEKLSNSRQLVCCAG